MDATCPEVIYKKIFNLTAQKLSFEKKWGKEALIFGKFLHISQEFKTAYDRGHAFNWNLGANE